MLYAPRPSLGPLSHIWSVRPPGPFRNEYQPHTGGYAPEQATRLRQQCRIFPRSSIRVNTNELRQRLPVAWMRAASAHTDISGVAAVIQSKRRH